MSESIPIPKSFNIAIGFEGDLLAIIKNNTEEKELVFFGKRSNESNSIRLLSEPTSDDPRSLNYLESMDIETSLIPENVDDISIIAVYGIPEVLNFPDTFNYVLIRESEESQHSLHKFSLTFEHGEGFAYDLFKLSRGDNEWMLERSNRSYSDGLSGVAQAFGLL